MSGRQLDIPLEWAEANDPYVDFRVLPYEPVTPTKGRLRSSTLLYATFASFGVLERGLEIVDAARRTFGMFATGWGCKLSEAGPSWEFYWYNEHFEPRTKSVAMLSRTLKSFGGLHVHVDPAIPYASFSLDLDEIIQGNDGVSSLNLYFGNGVDARCPGYSYLATATEMRLQNTYFVADTAVEDEMSEIRKRILYSARNGSEEATKLLLNLRPVPCRYVYFVNKPFSDALYFSQTDLNFWRRFLSWGSFPDSFASFVDDHLDALDHLRWDVGFNFVVEGGEVKVSKVGTYGYF